MASNRVLWLVRARARQSGLELRNSRTSKSTPGPGLRLFWADCFGKACFATDLGFKEIHVDARAGYVMAARGAGGAAGPAPRYTVQSNVCKQKRENATGKLPTCPDHSKGVYTCLNTVHTESHISVR